MKTLLVLVIVSLLFAGCGNDTPTPPPTRASTATAGPITSLPEMTRAATSVPSATAIPIVGRVVDTIPRSVATSTVVMVWDGERSSTTTLGVIGGIPTSLVLVLDTCQVRLDYATGDVVQMGACEMSEVAEVFWRGVNRYNPQLVGTEYKEALLFTGNLRRDIADLQRRRDDLNNQVTLLIDTLTVLRDELDRIRAARTPTP